MELIKRILPLRVEPSSYVLTDGHGETNRAGGECGRAFQGELRVPRIRPRPFYTTRHRYISVALTIGSKAKWVAEQTGTCIAMIQAHCERYIHDDGDALLRSYVEQPKREEIEEKTRTFAQTLLSEASNYWYTVVVPTGIEPVFPT